MESHQLHAFVAAARVGHVTRAAEVLCVAQPAVAAQIKGLESSPGVALFDRGGDPQVANLLTGRVVLAPSRATGAVWVP